MELSAHRRGATQARWNPSIGTGQRSGTDAQMGDCAAETGPSALDAPAGALEARTVRGWLIKVAGAIKARATLVINIARGYRCGRCRCSTWPHRWIS